MDHQYDENDLGLAKMTKVKYIPIVTCLHIICTGIHKHT